MLFRSAKLVSLNAHYINECDDKRLIELSKTFFKTRHNITLTEIAEKRIMNGIDELKSRAKTLHQFVDEAAFYAKDLPFEYDEKATNTLESSKDILKLLLDEFQNHETLTSEIVQAACKSIANDHVDGKMGKVAMPLRAAVTGTTISPSIFHACEILGIEETCKRIQAAL